MSPLVEEIKALHPQEPASTEPFSKEPEISEEQCQGLLIHGWNDEYWVLPWSHFIGAHYWPGAADKVDKIELTFAHQIVTVQGRNLLVLMESIAELRLRILREVPKDFAHVEPPSPEAEPVVIGMTVEMRES